MCLSLSRSLQQLSKYCLKNQFYAAFLLALPTTKMLQIPHAHLAPFALGQTQCD